MEEVQAREAMPSGVSRNAVMRSALPQDSGLKPFLKPQVSGLKPSGAPRIWKNFQIWKIFLFFFQNRGAFRRRAIVEGGCPGAQVSSAGRRTRVTVTAKRFGRKVGTLILTNHHPSILVLRRMLLTHAGGTLSGYIQLMGAGLVTVRASLARSDPNSHEFGYLG